MRCTLGLRIREGGNVGADAARLAMLKSVGCREDEARHALALTRPPDSADDAAIRDWYVRALRADTSVRLNAGSGPTSSATRSSRQKEGIELRRMRISSPSTPCANAVAPASMPTTARMRSGWPKRSAPAGRRWPAPATSPPHSPNSSIDAPACRRLTRTARVSTVESIRRRLTRTARVQLSTAFRRAHRDYACNN